MLMKSSHKNVKRFRECWEKVIKYPLKWFGQMWRRLAKALARRVDQLKYSPIIKGRGRPRKSY